MKHLLLSTLMILCAAAQSQNVQRVHQSNGTILQLPMSTIDSITYSTNAQSQTIMSIYQSNGSVIQLPAGTIDSVTYLTINPGNLASLTTLSIGNITASSAVSGGSISADGGSPVTHRGVCWATTQNPTTANNVAVAGSGIGTFTVNLSGLAPNTTYYIRAYAINTKGTAYGNQLSFTTSASSGGGGTGSQFNNNLTYGTVTDIDGNIYKTIQIGSQIWMAENLRVTKYRDGVSIPNITDNVQWQNNTTGAWSYYNQNAINNLTYGKLYNWHAVKSSRNICPAGWHMPKDEEWTILETTLGSNSVAGGKMKSTGTNFWTNPNADATNSSGFSALPAGSRSNTGEFQNAREYGLWWSVTDFTAGGWMRFAEFTGGNLYRDQFNKNYGLSVRCVFGDIATATTNSVTDITPTSAIGGGNITDDGGATITARGVVWSTSPNPTIFLPTKTNDGTGSGSFTSTIEGLIPNTTYYLRAYATNIVGTTYGNQVVFITDNIPSISTNSVTDITDTSAISGGNIISDGGDPVTSRGVVWSTNPNPTIDLDTKTNDGSGVGSFISNISGLTTNTTYYVRAYATNSVGTAYGNQVAFITDKIPTISTSDILNILATTATVGGNITSDGGDPVTARGVVWSTSANPTIDLTTKTNNGTGTGFFTSNITGLNQGTLYYVRAYATNSVGTAYGNELSFTTDNIPVLTTSTTSSITSSSAVSGGNITSDGGDPVTASGVIWSTSPNPTIDLTTKTINGSGTGNFSSTITGLLPATVYYVRTYATNSVGTAYGNEVTFTTLAILASLTTNQIDAISPSSANGGGNITSDGGASVSLRGIVWSTSPNPTISLQTKTTDGSGIGSFTSAIVGLASNTLYYIRAYATNSIGTAYGNQVTFTTDNIPTLTTFEASNILGTSAISGGNIMNDGGDPVTERGVVWGTSPNPTISLQTKTTDGSSTGSFTSAITDLTSNTLYYVRAYAINSAGIAYGNQITFTTDNIPTLTTTAASSILGTSAVSGGNIISDGGDPVIARGVVWSTSPNPTIDLTTKTNNGIGVGSFISNITGLNQGITYYVRAYAINSVGTAYGNQVTFNYGSIFNPDLTYGTMSDIDGNTYKTIQIGTQVWMAENLRTTKYRDETPILNITDSTQWPKNTSGAWCYYNNDVNNNIPYGKLYNWYAVANTNQLCPTGWHVPTDAEWTTLTNFLGGESVAGSKMKSTGNEYWVSPNTDASNSSGFSGLPGGMRLGGSSSVRIGELGMWWSITGNWSRILSNGGGEIVRFNSLPMIGTSVRCVRD